MWYEPFRIVLCIATCSRVLVDCADAPAKTGIWTRHSETKTLAVGNYDNLLKSGTVIVDKTLLTKTIMEIDKKIILITCPRKWGKTVNMEMLSIFFKGCVDPSHNDIPAHRLAKYRLFKEGVLYLDTTFYSTVCKSFADFYNLTKVKFESPPLIAEDEGFIEEYLGKFPVLSFTWFKATSYTQFLETLEYKIRDLFNEFAYLLSRLAVRLKLKSLTKEEAKQAQEDIDHLKLYARPFRLNDTELEGSLLFLSRLIRQNIGKPVLIFVDDWIAPLGQMLYYARKTEEIKIMRFLTNFVRKTLLENNYIKKAVLCGTLSIDRELLFGNYSDIAYLNVFNNDLQEFYGLTHNEAEKLFDYFAVPHKDTKKALDFFDGYNMKQNTSSTVYNIWSIGQYLNSDPNNREWNHWVKSGSLGSVEAWFLIERFRDIWISLIDGNTLLIEHIETSLQHKDLIFRITNIWGKNEQIDETMLNLIFSFLFEAGYLTISEPVGVVIDLAKTTLSKRVIHLRIPNQEIKEFIVAELNKTAAYHSQNQ